MYLCISYNCHLIVVYLSCSAKHAPSLKLMLVGLSGRGKSTLLSHLKYTGKTKTLPVTLRQRLESMNVDSTYNVFTNGSYLENGKSNSSNMKFHHDPFICTWHVYNKMWTAVLGEVLYTNQWRAT